MNPAGSIIIALVVFLNHFGPVCTLIEIELSYLPDPCAVPITKRTAWCGSRTLHWVKHPYVAVIARD
jgi:hypothetical protein